MSIVSTKLNNSAPTELNHGVETEIARLENEARKLFRMIGHKRNEIAAMQREAKLLLETAAALGRIADAG